MILIMRASRVKNSYGSVSSLFACITAIRWEPIIAFPVRRFMCNFVFSNHLYVASLKTLRRRQITLRHIWQQLITF